MTRVKRRIGAGIFIVMTLVPLYVAYNVFLKSDANVNANVQVEKPLDVGKTSSLVSSVNWTEQRKSIGTMPEDERLDILEESLEEQGNSARLELIERQSQQLRKRVRIAEQKGNTERARLMRKRLEYLEQSGAELKTNTDE